MRQERQHGYCAESARKVLVARHSYPDTLSVVLSIRQRKADLRPNLPVYPGVVFDACVDDDVN